MIINCLQYAAPCACGKTHEMITRLAVIEPGCFQEMDRYFREAGISGKRAFVYDDNTHAAVHQRGPGPECQVILPAEGLTANERAISLVMRQLPADTELLIAVGAGTIHDIVRYCAHKLGIPFVSCPTAASVDGFCSPLGAMTRHGRQALCAGSAPVLMLADVDILLDAPHRLTLSGVGEMLGKFTAVTDWKVASILEGRPVCRAAEALAWQAAVAAQGACARLREGDGGAIAQLMYGQVLSGLAMQMMAAEAPGFGAEHYMAALMEAMPAAFPMRSGTLHGELIGVLSAIVAGQYRDMVEIENIAACVKPYKPMDPAFYAEQFGPELGGALAEENRPDCLRPAVLEALVENWRAIRREVMRIPDMEEMVSMLKGIGAPATLEDIGARAQSAEDMARLSPYLSNQLTLMRCMRLLGDRYVSSAEASRAPSRSRRYADKAIIRPGSKSAVSASSIL